MVTARFQSLACLRIKLVPKCQRNCGLVTGSLIISSNKYESHNFSFNLVFF